MTASSTRDALADLVLHAMQARTGNTQAHWFLIDHVRGVKPDLVRNYLNGRASGILLVPPDETCRVVYFKDKSGVYVHEDGAMTLLGDDISGRVSRGEFKKITERK